MGDGDQAVIRSVKGVEYGGTEHVVQVHFRWLWGEGLDERKDVNIS